MGRRVNCAEHDRRAREAESAGTRVCRWENEDKTSDNTRSALTCPRLLAASHQMWRCTWRNGNQQKMLLCLSLSDELVCLIYQSATDLWNEGRGSRGLRGGEDGRNSFFTIYHRGWVSTKRWDGPRTVPSICFLLSDLLRTSYWVRASRCRRNERSSLKSSGSGTAPDWTCLRSANLMRWVRHRQTVRTRTCWTHRCRRATPQLQPNIKP